MAIWVGAGLFAGAILGAMGGGALAAVVLGAIGGGIGALVARALAKSKPVVDRAPPPPVYGQQPPVASGPAMGSLAPAPGEALSQVLARLDSIDARLARVETHLGVRDAATAPTDPVASIGERRPQAASAPAYDAVAPETARASLEAAQRSSVASDPASESRASQRAMSRNADGAMEAIGSPPAPPSESLPAADSGIRAEAAALARPGGLLSTPSLDQPPPRPAYTVDAATPPPPPVPRAPSAVWRWMTGGNALTRIGIVILFFGVAFLLRYFAEIVSVPIRLKLSLAGAGGIALALIGSMLARRRPAYGLSLQGAGMGIVYLTAFAAFRLYDVLAPVPAIALLVIVAASTIALALRHDSQWLAALALCGGFLAPVLIRTGPGDAALLFGYFAVLNAVIVALAWKRAWRPLNVLGFVFTFALGLFWGHRFYTPAHYAVVQPYLVLFFVFYVGIAILYARRGPLDAKAPVDGVLVFGVPIVGFALQMAIVRSHRYGIAWSAGALAAVYGLLWLLLRTRVEGGLALLARCFAALAVIFATLAIPFAADPRVTSAWWAVEAAAVYWLGVVQRQPLVRAFALTLQVVAALAFVWDMRPLEGRLLLNANFLGTALIGLSALASVWAADRDPARIGPRERSMLPLLFMWGTAWWIASGVDELRRQVGQPARIDAALAWVVASSALALALAHVLRWPRVAWIAATLLPAMGIAASADLRSTHTTLTHAGWLVWPVAWIVQAWTLRAGEALREGDAVSNPTRSDALRIAHTVSAVGLVAWASWEASEWAGRATAEGTVWIACAAALPAIAYLVAVVKWRESARWPIVTHAETYGASAGTAVAALLFAWFVIVNVVSPGDPSPLPYVPLVNPLDLTLAAALASLVGWDAAWGRHARRTRYGGLGAAAFFALNAAVVRTAHHWGDVAWRLEPLMAYRPLQAALTLTWTATALALMLVATRRGVRTLWTLGAVLLAVVVVKLFAIDLAALTGLTRVVAFMGVGLLLLVIGYVAPLPPATSGRPAPDAAVER